MHSFSRRSQLPNPKRDAMDVLQPVRTSKLHGWIAAAPVSYDVHMTRGPDANVECVEWRVRKAVDR